MKRAILTVMFILLSATCAFAQFGGSAGLGSGSQQYGSSGQPPFGSAGAPPIGGINPPGGYSSQQPYGSDSMTQPYSFGNPLGDQRYGSPGYNMGQPYGGSSQQYGGLGQPYGGSGDLNGYGSRQGLEDLNRPGMGTDPYSGGLGRGYYDGDFGSSRSWQLPGSVPGTDLYGGYGQRNDFGLGSRGMPGTGLGSDPYGGSGFGSGPSGSVFGPGGSSGGMSSGGLSGGSGR